MPPIADRAIVLARWEFSETSQTARLFCRDHGILRGIAKGARRDKAPFSGGLEPLTIGEVVAHPKRSDALAIIASWDLRDPLLGLRRDLWAFRAGCYIADALAHMVSDQDPHPDLFDLAADELGAIRDEPTGWGGLLRFLWGLLVECGYRPRIDDGPPGAVAFDPEDGRVVAAGGARAAWPIGRGAVAVLERLETAAPGGRTADRAHVEAACRLLARYLEHIVGKGLPSGRFVFG